MPHLWCSLRDRQESSPVFVVPTHFYLSCQAEVFFTPFSGTGFECHGAQPLQNWGGRQDYLQARRHLSQATVRQAFILKYYHGTLLTVNRYYIPETPSCVDRSSKDHETLLIEAKTWRNGKQWIKVRTTVEPRYQNTRYKNTLIKISFIRIRFAAP